jgi:hypothetical protein
MNNSQSTIKKTWEEPVLSSITIQGGTDPQTVESTNGVLS